VTGDQTWALPIYSDIWTEECWRLTQYRDIWTEECWRLAQYRNIWTEECWRLAQYRDIWTAPVNKVEKHSVQENADIPSLTKFCRVFSTNWLLVNLN
jgi:hypothetical protein